MATVPQYEIGQVKDKAVSGGFQQIQTNPDAFGASIAQAQIQQGQAISQLGDQAWQIAFQQRDKFDQAVLKDRDNELQDFIRDQLDVDGAFLSLKGKNALDNKAAVEKLIEERFKLLSKDIEPRILEQWKTVANQRINSAMGRIDNHSRTQTEVYYNNVSDSRIKGAVFDVISNYSDAAVREKYIKFGLNEIDQKLERSLGILPGTQDEDEKATRRDAHLQFTSAAHSGIVEKYLAADDYDRANEYYLKNKSEIKPDVGLQLEKAIDSTTRDGQVRDHVMEIWNTPGLSDTEQIEKAEKITDASLSELVVADLKNKQIYRDKETNDVEKLADDEADDLVTAGGITSLDQLPPDLLSRMSSTKKRNLKSEFLVEETRVRTENYRVAGENVLNQYAIHMTDNTQPLPSVADILKMKPTEAIAFMKMRDQDILDAATADELEAYRLVKNFQAEGGLKADIDKELWKRLSGEQKQIIDDRYKLKLERIETQAYEDGIALIAEGQEVPRELLLEMDGIQRLAIQKEQLGFDNRAESVAYDKLLGHLLIPGNTFDEAPDSLKEGVSNEHLYALQVASNTSKAKQAAKDWEITQVINYSILLNEARDFPEEFAKRDLQKEIPNISEANWKKLDEMQKNPASVSSIISREKLMYQTLAGLPGNRFNNENISTLITKEGKKGDDVRGFVTDIDNRVRQWTNSNPGKDMTDDDFKQILVNAASDKVYYDDWGSDTPMPASFISPDERDNAYILGDDYEKLMMDEIPQYIRESIIFNMRQNNEVVSERAIRDRFEIYKASLN
jgi:hypothetical protein